MLALQDKRAIESARMAIMGDAIESISVSINPPHKMISDT